MVHLSLISCSHGYIIYVSCLYPLLGAGAVVIKLNPLLLVFYSTRSRFVTYSPHLLVLLLFNLKPLLLLLALVAGGLLGTATQCSLNKEYFW